MFRKNRTLETKLKINCKNTIFTNCFYCGRSSYDTDINHAHFAADIQVPNKFMCLWSTVTFFIGFLSKLEKSQQRCLLTWLSTQNIFSRFHFKLTAEYNFKKMFYFLVLLHSHVKYCV